MNLSTNRPIDKPDRAAVSSKNSPKKARKSFIDGDYLDEVERDFEKPGTRIQQNPIPVASPPVELPPVQSQIETSQIETAQPETSHSEPAQSETAHFETAHSETSQIETAHSETSQIETAHPETSQNGIAQGETAHSETAQRETAQRETAQIETSQIETAHSEPSRDEMTPPETAHVETAQIETSQRETSQNETAQSETRAVAPLLTAKSQGAFLGLNKERAYDEIHKLKPVEYKLLSWLTLQAYNRGPEYKHGEGCAQVALSFMVKGTNIPRATLARTWKHLCEMGYAELVKKDQREGYIYRISNVLYQEPRQSRSETSQSETSQSDTASSLKMRRRDVSNRDTNKERETKKQKEGETPSALAPLWDLLVENWEKRGIKHEPKSGKTQGILSGLVKTWGENTTRAIIVAFFSDKRNEASSFQLRYLAADAHKYANQNQDKPKTTRAPMKAEF